MPRRSYLQLLLDERLPGGAAYWIGQQRGKGKSWRAIANEIADLTGIRVNRETLRLWFPDENGEAA